MVSQDQRTRNNKSNYNLRSVKRVDYNPPKLQLRSRLIKKQTLKPHNIKYIKEIITDTYEDGNEDVDIDDEYDDKLLWDEFNIYRSINQSTNQSTNQQNIQTCDRKDYISGGAVKNYLLKDPILDWLELYYVKYGFNENINLDTNINQVDPTIINLLQTTCERQRVTKKEDSHLSVLFEMGNKFEDEVMKYIREKFPDAVRKVAETKYDIVPESMKKTQKYMQMGVPIIEQAVLYNTQNNSYGVADILVRSDWINKLVFMPALNDAEINIKAPNLNGNYHYRVIDIKWTTMPLCSNGKLIRNTDRFPAYKGQLAIYNVAMGNLQGYIPNKAYILAKGWKYTVGKESYDGDNCFGLLGHINYAKFDFKYISQTINAIKWVRDVRYNGHRWSCVPPSRKELYPNMNNTYDTPYYRVKKELAGRIDELTQIWMVSTNNREIAHSNGVYSWSDPDCNAKIMGIKGKYVAPIVNKIIEINKSTNTNIILSPQFIQNNTYGWQTKKNTDFYVDFETVNGVFYNREINLHNSKNISDMIFMVGVGYEENNKWVYRSFIAEKLNLVNECKILQQFVDFIDSKIYNNTLSKPTIFHWGHAERTMFNNANSRHGNRWTNWKSKLNWLDFCSVFKQEPIVIKNAMKFNLKEIANTMYDHGLIKTKWDSDGVTGGLNAMLEACEYYRYIDNVDGMDLKELCERTQQMASVGFYNEIDCKVMWEIVIYLRNHHISKST